MPNTANDLPHAPIARYAMGPVGATKKPGSGPVPPVYQCDADTVGHLRQRIGGSAQLLADCLEELT